MLNLLNTYINSPLDQFEIRVFLGFVSPFFDLSCLSFTTFTLYVLIVLVTILGLNLLTDNNNKIVGSRWFVSQEAMYDTILNMVKGQIGGKFWGYYFPLVYTFFIFIFTANLISMIPYSFALSAHLVFVVSLSTVIWLGVTILGLYRHGWVFFSLFVPAGTPLPLVPLLVLIELLSYFARAISLGLRLSANTIAGHLLMIILGGLLLTFMSISYIYFIFGFIPLIGILAIVCLEFAIAMIQSYVWAILTSSYLKDALYLH
uniref:ATP synthase subunit a n=2 Tax=Lachancea kluyveri TaxID=4934 RepID=I4ENT9_LACKL|nr:putative ATP synthase, subunit 6 [Lachancea kluyveri]CCG06527.1 putative ATP synthase, subunit 6 [Lachancea kluyveri]CCG06535.1 putative ATP synthase, subunit 6 [Lachancea kluyveri]CCG55092.1 putative ATP synthase, subunit 6 [Lachancea kluyveri]